MRRLKKARSYHERQEQYKRRLESSKENRRFFKERSIKRSMLGITRYIENHIVKFDTGISANKLDTFCCMNDIDHVEFNHATQVEKQDVLCYCFFNNEDKKFYVRPLIIAERVKENKDLDLSQLSLMSTSVCNYFEENNIDIKIFDPIWLVDMINHVFKRFDEIFFIEFKVRSGWRSFATTIFFSRNSRGFKFEFTHRDLWFTSFQKDLEKFLIDLLKWSQILMAVSESETWDNFELFTFFPCSNITVWRKVANQCAINNKYLQFGKDSIEEIALIEVCKFARKKPLQFRNSVKIHAKFMNLLGKTFSLTKETDRITFLSVLKSFGLFEDFEADAAFVKLTNV